jgi:hypothetical protein
VGRVKTGTFLKKNELVLQDQREFAHQAELVWRPCNERTISFEQANEITDKAARILEMLDRLQRDDYVDAISRLRNRFRIEVNLMKLALGGK